MRNLAYSSPQNRRRTFAYDVPMTSSSERHASPLVPVSSLMRVVASRVEAVYHDPSHRQPVISYPLPAACGCVAAYALCLVAQVSLRTWTHEASRTTCTHAGPSTPQRAAIHTALSTAQRTRSHGHMPILCQHLAPSSGPRRHCPITRSQVHWRCDPQPSAELSCGGSWRGMKPCPGSV